MNTRSLPRGLRRLILSLFFASIAVSGRATPPPAPPASAMSPKDAEAILTKTTPFTNPPFIVDTDPARRAKKLALFNNQLLALATLKSSKAAYDPKVVIPYLPYTSDISVYDASTALKSLGSKENIAESGITWPAFGALLANPKSAPALAAYCINKANPLNLRIASFLVLRYVDRQKFNSVSEIMKREFQNCDPCIQPYLNGIIAGTTRFGVAPPLKYFDARRPASPALSPSSDE